MRKPLEWYREPGLGWVRVFGRGVHIRDTARHPLLFSEREGFRPFWTFRWLR